uniref:Uncharacterized protein n=1 Tax=viral metagenome TaxID=1070528 RepID=A0A6C0AV84_9ZZZZ
MHQHLQTLLVAVLILKFFQLHMHTFIGVIMILLIRMNAKELTYHGVNGTTPKIHMLLHLILQWETLTIMWSPIEITKILTAYIFIAKLQPDLLQNGIMIIQMFSLVL